MGQADFRHGSPVMVDYTPSGSAVNAGDVVVVGNTPMIAHRDIADGVLGAMAAGGGVYRTTADGAIGQGVIVYWDDSEDKVSTTASSNTVFGITVSSAAADDDPIDVLHQPDGKAAA